MTFSNYVAQPHMLTIAMEVHYTITSLIFISYHISLSFITCEISTNIFLTLYITCTHFLLRK